MKIPKGMNITYPHFKDGKAYVNVTIKRWALPMLIWRMTRNHGCTLKLCGINISFLIRPLLVVMFMFKANKQGAM